MQLICEVTDKNNNSAVGGITPARVKSDKYQRQWSMKSRSRTLCHSACEDNVYAMLVTHSYNCCREIPHRTMSSQCSVKDRSMPQCMLEVNAKYDF